MENLIGRLLKIDKAACKLVEDATKLREQAVAGIAAAKTDVDQQIRAEAEAQISQQQSKVQAEIAAAKAQAAQAAEENRDTMKRIYDDNMDRWVEHIVASCTKL